MRGQSEMDKTAEYNQKDSQDTDCAAQGHAKAALNCTHQVNRTRRPDKWDTSSHFCPLSDGSYTLCTRTGDGTAGAARFSAHPGTRHTIACPSAPLGPPACASPGHTATKRITVIEWAWGSRLHLEFADAFQAVFQTLLQRR
jgi:hypothetical protein